MTKSFSVLLSDSLAAWQSKMKVVLITLVIFAVVMQLAQMFILSSASVHVPSPLGEISEERMQELMGKYEGGDDGAMQQLMQEMGMMNDDGSVQTREEVAAQWMWKTVRSMLPALTLYFFIAQLIALLAKTTYLIIAVEKAKDLGAIFTRMFGLVPRMIGLYLWILIRTFIWIPILGIIPAIILGPRFALAPLLVVQKDAGVMDSASMSYTATTGYWGKIVGNSILLGLLLGVVSMIIGMFAAVFSSIEPKVGLFVGGLIGQAVLSFGMFFYYGLADTILKNPIKK